MPCVGRDSLEIHALPAALLSSPGLKSKGTVAIVGPGRLGSALAHALRSAGYSIAQIFARPSSRLRARALAKVVGAKVSIVGKTPVAAEVVWICVPDSEIAACARRMAQLGQSWKGRVVLHASGALSSDELDSLRKLGASVVSAHPLMTFAAGTVPDLGQVGFAMEGDPRAVTVARSMVRKLGAETYPIRKRDKAAYHAWGAFASPLLVALFISAERVAAAANVAPAQARRRMLPILRTTLENYAKLGPEAAFTGPIARGDLATIRKHLRVLKNVKGASDVHRALANAALLSLPAKNRGALRKLLAKR
jgi:predicted short-subunit dehydrogenase-like oxidoreductase (DUF2520 family)